MSPPCFTCSRIIKNIEKLIEELKNVFDVMHASNTARFELAAYKMKGVSRMWSDLWKVGRDEYASLESWACFE